MKKLAKLFYKIAKKIDNNTPATYECFVPNPGIIKTERDNVKLRAEIQIDERNEHLPGNFLKETAIRTLIPELLANASIVETETHNNDKYMSLQIEVVRPKNKDKECIK